MIGGYVAKREGQLVRAVLADGRTWIYDPEDANGAWLFAVQRCGDFAETAFRAVEEINQDGTVIVRLPVPGRPASPRRRQLRILNASPRRACGRPKLSTIRQRSVEHRNGFDIALTLLRRDVQTPGLTRRKAGGLGSRLLMVAIL